MLELHILGHYWRVPYVLCRKHPSLATVGRTGLDEVHKRISASNPVGVFLSVRILFPYNHSLYSIYLYLLYML
jgi:hypothetical protein